MKFKPVISRVVIEPDPPKTHSIGGIILIGKDPDAKRGRVVATGMESVLKEGDEVLYEANAGDPYEEGGKKYMIVSEEQVIAVV